MEIRAELGCGVTALQLEQRLRGDVSHAGLLELASAAAPFPWGLGWGAGSEKLRSLHHLSFSLLPLLVLEPCFSAFWNSFEKRKHLKKMSLGIFVQSKKYRGGFFILLPGPPKVTKRTLFKMQVLAEHLGSN